MFCKHCGKYNLDIAKYCKNCGKEISFRKTKTINIWLILVLTGIAITLLYGPISDELIILNSDANIIKIAQESGMSRKGELIFLRTNPQIDSPSQFMQDCSIKDANNGGYPELGCYYLDTNKIYLLSMPTELYKAEVTTAVHEMLHSVYNQINSPQLNQIIENNYSRLSGDVKLNERLSMYDKTEPGARNLELFSILGTEYSNISSDLYSYYSPYFTNGLSTIVTYNQQIDALFSSYESQLSQLKNRIDQDEKNADIAYKNSVSWARVGNQYQNNRNYNIYLQYFNDGNAAINQYNQILTKYNLLVTAYTGGQPVNQMQQQSSK